MKRVDKVHLLESLRSVDLIMCIEKMYTCTERSNVIAVRIDSDLVMLRIDHGSVDLLDSSGKQVYASVFYCRKKTHKELAAEIYEELLCLFQLENVT